LIDKINMSEKTEKFLTAAETIAALGISKQTLYTYVSRGRLRGRSDPANPRRHLYDARDVARILEVKARGRARKKIAQSTIHFGEPILQTSLSNIVDGRFYYRGKDAVDLSDSASLEDIACLLWNVSKLPPVKLPPAKPAKGATPLDRAMRAVADIAAVPLKDELRDATLLLKLMARQIAGVATDPKLPIHRQLARAWKVQGDGEDLIRRALVLCADHELNASTYAVRVVASTRASLAASILAGLGALSWPLHGGLTNRVGALMKDRTFRRDPEKALGKLYAEKGWVPGFGHRLYPDGDPRGRVLIEASKPCLEWQRFVAAGFELTGEGPTIDVGNALLQDKLRLPEGAGFGIFALGRTVGWIAHALEQRREGTLIRPRAEFKA
jgi:citrate synthase